MNKKIKTYKMTDADMKCKGFQFEIGKRYEHEGKVSICNSGFHSCIKPTNCLAYYSNNGSNRIFLCEIELIGNEVFEGGESIETSKKLCSSNITFIEELSHKFSELMNTGDGNTGDGNTGDWNTGYWNTGDGNTGNRNTGDWNTGDWNTGNRNTGNRNTGNRNTGNRNTGDRNTGDWNTGDGNTNFFCTITPPSYFFNKISDKKKHEVYFPSWLYFELVEWVYSSSMTDAEKESNPSHETCGGFLRVKDYKQAAQESYNKATKEEQRSVEDIPNYTPELLFEIFGINRKK